MRPYRKEKIASLIQTVVAEEISFRLHDPRVARFTSVTRVEVAGDLSVARVYIVVAGDDAVERNTLRGVRHAAGRIQRTLAGRLQARQCPRLNFMLDESVKKVRHTLRILDANRRSREAQAAARPADGDAAADAPAGSGQTEAAAPRVGRRRSIGDGEP
ncbi:MAG: 30S ribosome-binding factor RbfA [Phycisphaerae bacterium]